MKIKTSELVGAALDWAVAKCEKVDIGHPDNVPFNVEWRLMHDAGDMNYSTDWAQGGPIIEREGMTIALDAYGWEARHYDGESEPWVFTGPTPLIAAMRCYVSSKLGDDVDVPEELT